MATLPPTTRVALTFADWAKRFDDDMKTATIVEMLSLTNAVMDDMLVVEGNLPTGHKTTIRTGLPTPTWRLLNYGITQSKSTTAQITDTVGNLEALAKVDKDLVNLNGGSAAFRLSESQAFIEAMSQTMATTVFYGNSGTNPERFMGLAPRYNNTNSSASSANVLDALGTGLDNTSVWLVVWGERTIHGIFPKGKTAGLSHDDLGIQLTYDENNATYLAYVDHYKWELGMSVRDWRYAVRICNIDVSDLIANATAAANLVNLMIRAVYRIPTIPRGVANTAVQQGSSGVSGGAQTGMQGRAAIYCNRIVATYLDIQANSKTTLALQSQTQVEGQPILTFRGIPIKICDAILNNEARVI
jgi:hypothetical protein